MTILQDDLQFYAAERLTDADDAGGFATGTVILDNEDNNLFPDIASGDRIAGRTHLRKCFAAVRSADDDVLMSGRVFLVSPTTDTDVSVALFAGETGEELAAAKAALEANTRGIYGIMTVATEAAAAASAVTVDTIYLPVCPSITEAFEFSTALNTYEGIPKYSGWISANADGQTVSGGLVTINSLADPIDFETIVAYYVDVNGLLRTISFPTKGTFGIAASGDASGSIQWLYFEKEIRITSLTLTYRANPYARLVFSYSMTTNVEWDGAIHTLQLNPPVVPESVTVTANATDDDGVISDTDDGAGRFGVSLLADSYIEYESGFLYVHFPETIKSETLSVTYNVGIQSPIDPELLGIDPTKFPNQGRRAGARVGDFVLLQNLDDDTLTNPVVAGATYTLTRDHVQSIWLEDATGTRIPTAKYTLSLTAGSVTMANPLDLSGYTQPLTAYTALQDESMVTAVAGNTLTLNRALVNTYPADTSTVSSMIRTGDLSAALTVQIFAQQAWTTVWSNSRIGDAITPQYNDITYPVVVTNDGAITERWRIQFTGTTTVNIIGESVGQIATGLSITSDLAPNNPFTSTPYFTIDADGWGAGWVSGNLIRFNTSGAEKPLWAVRCVQPSDPPVAGTTDRIRLGFVGDVNA